MLSKEELISLISELADKQENIKHLLNEKFSEFETDTVRENDEVSSDQKFPVTLNKVLPSVTRLSSPQEKIDLYKTLFCDEFCRDVIGLYPLLEGNLCHFLAMDFDAHSP